VVYLVRRSLLPPPPQPPSAAPATHLTLTWIGTARRVQLSPSAPPSTPLPQDEFWTSQRCHQCTNFLVDGPKHREKSCGTCGVINRDVNAARNLETVWEWWLAFRTRPPYLTRPPDHVSAKSKTRAKAKAKAQGAAAGTGPAAAAAGAGHQPEAPGPPPAPGPGPGPEAAIGGQPQDQPEAQLEGAAQAAIPEPAANGTSGRPKRQRLSAS